MRIALAQINPIIGALEENRKTILEFLFKAKLQKADLVIFPELAICGYHPEDLLLHTDFIEAIAKELLTIAKECSNIAALIGCVRKNESQGEKSLYNSACLIINNKIIDYYDKMLLPDYDVFSERRYFEPGKKVKSFVLKGKRIGVTICEDIWQHANEVGYSFYTSDPIEMLKKEGLDLLVNLSASPFYSGRQKTRFKVCAKAAKTLQTPLVLVNQVGANDSLIFDGCSSCVNERGELIHIANNFQSDLIFWQLDEKKEPIEWPFDDLRDLFDALCCGVRDYFQKQGFKTALLGVSGGIDSALVASIAVHALGRENLKVLFMPSRFTSQQSYEDVEQLVKNLQVECHTLSIERPYSTFLELLAPSFEGYEEDITEENLQARIRGMILMAFSNKFGSIVLAAGNKSELALGYSTLYGDMCGGLEVIGDLTKAQVYALSSWLNREKEIIPRRILEKPPTAELRANQKDSDTLPSYEIIDGVIEDYIEHHQSIEQIVQKRGYPLELVKELVGKIHKSEYKRRQAPLGLRVTRRAFSMGRRWPIVQLWNR